MSVLTAMAAKLKRLYSIEFDIPFDIVTVEYFRHVDCREDVKITSPLSPEVVWTALKCNVSGCCK